MLEDLKSYLGQIPALEKRILKIEEWKNCRKTAVVCENCGNLVTWERAQVIPEVVERMNFVLHRTPSSVEPAGQEFEIMKHYLCNHCDAKKFNKKYNIK